MPQPTRRRNLRGPKQDKNNSSSDSSSDYENRKHPRKAPNKIPKESARRGKKDDSLAHDVDKIRSANVTYEKETMYRLRRLQDTSSPNLPRPHFRKEKKKKELVINSLAVVVFVLLFILGHYTAYRIEKYDEHIKSESLLGLLVRIETESWKKDSGNLCKQTIDKAEDFIKNNWSSLPSRSVMGLAISYTNEKKHLSAILLHYAAILIELRKTPAEERGESFEGEILDNLFLAQLSLKSIGEVNKNPERLACLQRLWLSITGEIVRSYVKRHNEELFRQAWYNVHLALTYSRLELWELTMAKSGEAMTIIKNAYHDDAFNYEVYCWACYIYFVAIEKHEKYTPSQDFKTLLLKSAGNMGSATDKLVDVDSVKIFNRLFPHKLPETKKQNP